MKCESQGFAFDTKIYILQLSQTSSRSFNDVKRIIADHFQPIFVHKTLVSGPYWENLFTALQYKSTDYARIYEFFVQSMLFILHFQ